MKNIKWIEIISLFFCWLCLSQTASAQLTEDLRNLHAAYPDFIRSVHERYIVWKDGSTLPIRHINMNGDMNYEDDWGRVRYESLFRKMYGNSPKEVEKNLVVIYWMPKVFGHKYPLQVTRVNGVDKKLQKVSAELEKLPASYHKYLKGPEGTYSWRNIAHTRRLSMHSFGMTIDLNRRYGDYWQWDLEKAGRRISESARLPYRNRIPTKIVEVFEKHGFLWGGDWAHYDTMHFEYRPELV